MKDNELQQLGIFRIPIPIPFPQAGGPVNACIFEHDDGLLLFDPGIGTAEAHTALADGFAKAGHRLQDVSRIILSHGHIDHFGASAWVMEQAGRDIPVSIHNADAEKVLQSGAYWPELIERNGNYLRSLGIPPPLLDQTAVKLSRNVPSLGERLRETAPLKSGEIIRCKHVVLEAMHMPGHTPGLCCLYESSRKILFSGDHLLERVSPNPLMDLRGNGSLSPFKPLITYFNSLERVRALPIDLVVPGHGSPFAGYLKVIDTLHSFYERRQERILDILKEQTLTVYEVMQELFVGGDGFELILMMSESLANLEVLEEKGQVIRMKEDSLIRFRRHRG